MKSVLYLGNARGAASRTGARVDIKNGTMSGAAKHESEQRVVLYDMGFVRAPESSPTDT